MIMPFGKHKGQPVEDLPEDYLQWLKDNVELRSRRLKDAVDRALAGSKASRNPFYSDSRQAPPRKPEWAIILGVSAAAGRLEIASAYRQRAMETHPDRGGTAAAFRRIHLAYEQAICCQPSQNEATRSA